MKWYSIFLIGVALLLFNSCVKKSEVQAVCVFEIADQWKFKQTDKDEWKNATVPGSVHTDLLNNGIIEDPFYRLNEHDVQWVDKKDWIYQTTLTISEELLNKDRIILDFKGLDTHADVYLNEEKIFTADNMFRGWQVDVKQQLKSGENQLKVYFHSPIKVGVEKYDNYSHEIHSSANDLAEIGNVEGNKRVSVHLRKAQYHFGWDWGPRLVSSGIWQPVYLKAWDNARIVDLRIVQNEIGNEKATLTAEFEIEAEQAMDAKLEINIDEKPSLSVPVQIEPGIKIYSVDFEIVDPELWWSNGLGEAHLYKVNGRVITSEGYDEKAHNIGLRTLKVIREEDEEGKTFYIKLNGHSVFMKGANFIPGDVFLDRVSPQKYEEIILTAKESNHNMLRVWGGGIYEKNIFYDLCDQHGILVWQDFMFACNMYPGDSAFLESVREEAEYNIKRLRNHPSIALWCGNNEVLAAWKAWGWEEESTEQDPVGAKAQWQGYKDIFLKVLPEAINKLDPQRFYHPSSPQSGDSLVNVYNLGDHHYWGVWWGKEEFSNYHIQFARFMSEYGFQSFPEMKAINLFTEKEDWDIYSDVMKSHQRSSIGNSTIELYMLRDYIKPKNFPSFIYVGQVLQAEGIKQAMESHRIAMPYNMGSLYWQINDCWPVASWSSTDYYGNWKAMQYYAKKAFAEVVIAPRVLEETLEVHVASDRLEGFSAVMELNLLDFSGNSLWAESTPIKVGANTSQAFFTKSADEFLVGFDRKEVILAVALKENGNVIAQNNLHFDRVKNLELPKPNVTYTVAQNGKEYSIELSTDVLAKNVFLSAEDSDGFFSDNYFDMLPGETKKITFRSDQTIADLENELTVLTIRDTY